MNWISEVVLILSVTSIVHKIIGEVSFYKFKKRKDGRIG